MRQAVGRGPEPRTATPDGSGGTVRGVRRRFRRRPTQRRGGHGRRTPTAPHVRPAGTVTVGASAHRQPARLPDTTQPDICAATPPLQLAVVRTGSDADRRCGTGRGHLLSAARPADRPVSLAQRPAAMTVEAAAEGPQRFLPGGSMEPVTGHLTAAGRNLPGHPVRPHDDVAAQDRTPQAADGQSAACSLPLNRRSLRLVTTFSTSLKAGPAGGRLRRPSSAGCTTRPGRRTVPTAQTLHAAKGAGIGTPRGATKKLYRGGAEWAPLHSVFSSIPYCLSS
jgi:hypothetical protein